MSWFQPWLSEQVKKDISELNEEKTIFDKLCREAADWDKKQDWRDICIKVYSFLKHNKEHNIDDPDQWMITFLELFVINHGYRYRIEISDSLLDQHVLLYVAGEHPCVRKSAFYGKTDYFIHFEKLFSLIPFQRRTYEEFMENSTDLMQELTFTKDYLKKEFNSKEFSCWLFFDHKYLIRTYEFEHKMQTNMKDHEKLTTIDAEIDFTYLLVLLCMGRFRSPISINFKEIAAEVSQSWKKNV